MASIKHLISQQNHSSQRKTKRLKTAQSSASLPQNRQVRIAKHSQLLGGLEKVRFFTESVYDWKMIFVAQHGPWTYHVAFLSTAVMTQQGDKQPQLSDT